MTKRSSSSAGILKSFRFAFSGVRLLFKEEKNARIHLLATICIVIAGFICKISAFEWMAITFAIGLVIALEAVNTAVEHIADFVSPDQHDRIKKIKDLTAAAVLVGALTALVIGAVIFIPRIIHWLS